MKVNPNSEYVRGLVSTTDKALCNALMLHRAHLSDKLLKEIYDKLCYVKQELIPKLIADTQGPEAG